jgi:hypothetical protein
MRCRAPLLASLSLLAGVAGCGPSVLEGVELGGDPAQETPDSGMPADTPHDADVLPDSTVFDGSTGEEPPSDAGGDADATGSDGGEMDDSGVEPAGACELQTVCSSPVYPCVELSPSGYTCDGLSAEWPMPSSAPAAKVAPSYDGTSVPQVTVDNVTGLWWQRTVGAPATWDDAQAACAALALGGADDWRLPSMMELVSLLDEVAVEAPRIDGAAFPGTPGAEFWSSTRPSAVQALVVAFDLDWTYRSSELTMERHVRCVRGAPKGPFTPAQRYSVEAASDTVTDTRTGLVWERSLSDVLVYAEAEAHCASLGGGFRVPTFKELFTLLDRSRTPSIAAAFGATPSEPFWSSIPHFSDAMLMNSLSFDSGEPGAIDRAVPYRVRCVR